MFVAFVPLELHHLNQTVIPVTHSRLLLLERQIDIQHIVWNSESGIELTRHCLFKRQYIHNNWLHCSFCVWNNNCQKWRWVVNCEWTIRCLFCWLLLVRFPIPVLFHLLSIQIWRSCWLWSDSSLQLCTLFIRWKLDPAISFLNYWLLLLLLHFWGLGHSSWC